MIAAAFANLAARIRPRCERPGSLAIFDRLGGLLYVRSCLANEISGVRGISKLLATGRDLQLALRRSRDLG